MTSNRKFFTAFGLVLTAFLIIVFPVTAQDRTNPTAFLVYYDDDFELEVFDSSGDYIGEVFIGMELFPGSTIKTYNTSAEIQLDPNGSILKISENSVFQIEAFQTTEDESNDFSLFNGKLRVIAARAGLGYENYSIITQSAVCGVRGTDFVIDSIGVLAVNDGAVEFSSLLSGDTIDVISGQMADVFADSFAAISASAQNLSSIFSGMDFKGTDPKQVPGHTATVSDPAAGADTADDETTEEEPAAEDGTEDPEDNPADNADGEAEEGSDTTTEESADDQTKSPAGNDDKKPAEKPTPSRTGSAAAAITGRAIPDASKDKEASDDEETDEPKESGPVGMFFDGLADLFQFEIGSINIKGKTYAKAVIQPEFEIGKFRAGLYLPVIYQDNLFEPGSWYQPAGNNEWSFGTDQETAQDIAFDIVNDLFLKINYLQWGDNGDDFYLKFGNLDNMTIGHGILMKNFTNNFEFPAIRKVGINTGFNFENFGFEAVLDDASDPTIFGGRLVYIPFGESFPLGLGISGITDINPDSEIEETLKFFDPLVLNAAFDIGLPITPINMTLFADVAGLTVYGQLDGDSSKVWHFETIYNEVETDFLTALNNYGLSTGFYGELLSLEYRLEYRLSKGIFTPTFYGTNYLATKTAQYNSLMAYIADPSDSAYQDITMGVYGELSANFFDAVTIGGGYLWPWEIDEAGNFDFTADDSFSLSAQLMPDVIPIVGLNGSVTYTRTGLVNSIKNAVNGSETFELINSGTLISGELIYPFDPSLDIALQFATAFNRDDDGNLIFGSDGSLDTYFAMSVDMRIHF